MYSRIIGTGSYLPKKTVTNKDLEKFVDTNDEWIESRTGIKQRRILRDPKKAMSDMGVEAVKQLLEKTNTKPEEVEMI